MTDTPPARRRPMVAAVGLVCLWSLGPACVPQGGTGHGGGDARVDGAPPLSDGGLLADDGPASPDGGAPGVDRGIVETDGGPGCTPDCGARVCGDDGCGDVCGTCDDGLVCDADGRCQSPDEPGGAAPRIVTFGANVQRLTEGEQIVFSAIVTDPDGIDDVIGGVLEDARGVSYGVFSTSGQEGAYGLILTWAEIDAVEPIEFEASQQRTFVAVFFDQGERRVEAAVRIELHCDGFGACDGVCTPWDTGTDCGGCGQVCDAVCDAGRCVCPEGEIRCDGICTAIESDPAHCGGCDRQCPDAEGGAPRCEAGVCGDPCPGDAIDCGGRCADLSADEAHCGACGNACPRGASCAAGRCACDAGDVTCGNRRCVAEAAVCNRVDDCGDGTDEAGCCFADAECPLGQRCAENRCVDGCSNDARCPPDAYCLRDACVPRCQRHDDCNAGEYCDGEGLCIQGCRDDDGCGVDQVCLEHRCMAGCRDDAQCRAGWQTPRICVDNQCVDGCRDAMDCVDAEVELCVHENLAHLGCTCYDNACMAAEPVCLNPRSTIGGAIELAEYPDGRDAWQFERAAWEPSWSATVPSCLEGRPFQFTFIISFTPPRDGTYRCSVSWQGAAADEPLVRDRHVAIFARSHCFRDHIDFQLGCGDWGLTSEITLDLSGNETVYLFQNSFSEHASPWVRCEAE